MLISFLTLVSIKSLLNNNNNNAYSMFLTMLRKDIVLNANFITYLIDKHFSLTAGCLLISWSFNLLKKVSNCIWTDFLTILQLTIVISQLMTNFVKILRCFIFLDCISFEPEKLLKFFIRFKITKLLTVWNIRKYFCF